MIKALKTALCIVALLMLLFLWSVYCYQLGFVVAFTGR